MKKFLKSSIFAFILGGIILGSIGVYAGSQMLASAISYKDTTVDQALDDLYDKANNQTVCMLLSGTKNTVSAKYHCDLGDGVLRNFYILAVDGDEVKLIMEKNITDEILVNNSRMLSWNDAMTFFDENNPGYTIGQQWLKKVQNVGLPSAQDIANSGGITGVDVTTATEDDYNYFGSPYGNKSNANIRGNYAWLYNYTRGCSSNGCTSGTNNYPDSEGYPYGYWTKDLVAGSSPSHTWTIGRAGVLDSRLLSTDEIKFGVRPVITLSKSNLVG